MDGGLSDQCHEFCTRISATERPEMTQRLLRFVTSSVCGVPGGGVKLSRDRDDPGRSVRV